MKHITKMQKMLAELLKELRISKDSAISIGLMIQQDKEIKEFAKWVECNMSATESEILKYAVSIYESKSGG